MGNIQKFVYVPQMELTIYRRVTYPEICTTNKQELSSESDQTTKDNTVYITGGDNTCCRVAFKRAKCLFVWCSTADVICIREFSARGNIIVHHFQKTGKMRNV